MTLHRFGIYRPVGGKFPNTLVQTGLVNAKVAEA
jgi:hypothetical protein